MLTMLKYISKGVFKVNIDASFSSLNHSVGLGIIIRNHQGQVMATETKYVEFVGSVDEAEAFALIDSRIQPIQLETDSMRIFNLLNR